MNQRKIHKTYYTFGSLTVCGITAYSQENINESWKGVNCKRCLRYRKLKEKRIKYKDKDLDYCRAEVLGSVGEIERKLKKLEKEVK